jgi:hypothetical protein
VRRPTLLRLLVAGAIVIWLAGAAVTVSLLVVLHGEESPACERPDADSSYGDARLSLVPLGLYCEYPARDGLPRLADGSHPGLGHLAAEVYLIAVPVGLVTLLVRRRNGTLVPS